MLEINEKQQEGFIKIGRTSGNANGWVLVFPGGIGDSYIALSLLNSFITHHEVNDRVNLVLSENQASLSYLFPGNWHICSIAGAERLWGHAQVFSPAQMFHRDVPFIVHPSFVADGRSVHLMEKRDFTFVDVFKYILRIPFESVARTPEISEEIYVKAEKFAEEKGIVKGESVIIFPSARTIKSLPKIFWEELVKHLQKSGLNVFSNLVPNSGEDILQGATVLNFPIDWVIPLCEYAGFTVSTLTGTAVVSSAAKAKKIIVARVDQKILSSLNTNDTPIDRSAHIWTMEKIGVPFNGAEVFFHDEDDFGQAANLVSSLLI